MERRLAAILAADVVDFSRLMEANEVETLERLKSLRRELVQPAIALHKGRIVKLMGDGLLAEFPSVVEAVQCAVGIQHAVIGHESAIGETERIRLRIGVNLGDIIIEGSDIYGDGVNIAARLEGLAEPGGVCISRAAFETINGKLDIAFEDIGERTLKNIAKPVRVYRFVTEPARNREFSANRLSAGKPSIAVLPFANMSGDAEQEYFSDGITEDLITELSRFRDLAVVSRNSSFVFKGKSESLREVGARLNVQYIVEGSVRKAGSRVRVTAQLIDVSGDRHVWAERYDRSLEDIFEVQDDIVRRVASTLAGKLETEGQSRIRHESKGGLRAYDLYLRGREHFVNWSLEDYRKARECLEAAIAIEPGHAAALALLSEVLLRTWMNGWSENSDADLDAALDLAQKADALDDQDSRTQVALGLAHLFHGDREKAKHHLEAATRLNPNDMRALLYISRVATLDGDTARAVELCSQALTLNPFGKYNYHLAVARFAAGQYAETIDLLVTIGNPPVTVLALLAASYAMVGDEANAAIARARFAEAVKTSPGMSKLDGADSWRRFFAVRWPFRDPANFELVLQAMRRGGVPV